MLKIGILGCGKIADQHADVLKYLPYCEISGACDSDILMAKQLYERYNVKKGYYDNIYQFLEEVKPDVVHVTTPPQSHFELGKICLEAGANIYIEKPLTVNFKETDELIKLAESKKLKLTVGHNAQFTNAERSMREIIASGFLGGPPIHIEGYYCYDLSDKTYAQALLSDKNHWVRNLPGKLLHNIISHGISKIAEHMTGKGLTVTTRGYNSRILRDLGEEEIIDELRVIITDETPTSAYFTFSSQLKPILHQVILYGQNNSLLVNDDYEVCVKIKGSHYKSYLNQFIPPVNFAKEYFKNSINNMYKFLKSDLRMNGGLNYLIEAFYLSIIENRPLPISYEEIRLTYRIMDLIFKQIETR